MTKHFLLRKLSLLAMNRLCMYAMAVVVLVCYFEVGHDKGWPRAGIMYTRFHGLVVSAAQTFVLHTPCATNN